MSSKLVPEPNLEAMERLIGEAKDLKQPLLSVESQTRERFIGEMREHEKELEALEDTRNLFVREMQAALDGLDAQIADRRGAISLYRGGLAPEIERLDQRDNRTAGTERRQDGGRQ